MPIGEVNDLAQKAWNLVSESTREALPGVLSKYRKLMGEPVPPDSQAGYESLLKAGKGEYSELRVLANQREAFAAFDELENWEAVAETRASGFPADSEVGSRYTASECAPDGGQNLS